MSYQQQPPEQWGQAPAPAWPEPQHQPADPVVHQPPPQMQPHPQMQQPQPQVQAFFFDGGAGSYFVTGLLAFIVTVFSFGLLLPWAIVMRESWKARHTFINGHRLMFTGTGMGLFGNWIKWWALTVITFGFYSFWIVPRLQKWKVEHHAFDPRG